MARGLYAGAHLLDRQLVDRAGRRCGKVDDVELTLDESGPPHVSAVVCGPGALLTRLHRTRLGHWLRKLLPLLHEGEDRGRIPIRNVAAIDEHLTLSLAAAELATHDGEQWVLQHVIGHLPGSRTRAGE